MEQLQEKIKNLEEKVGLYEENIERVVKSKVDRYSLENELMKK